MLFVILPTNKIDNYAAVKKRLSVNIGIPSQCFLSKNVTNKGLMSVATKVVIQMNAKLGGEPWSCPVPVKVKKIYFVFRFSFSNICLFQKHFMDFNFIMNN